MSDPIIQCERVEDHSKQSFDLKVRKQVRCGSNLDQRNSKNKHKLANTRVDSRHLHLQMPVLGLPHGFCRIICP